MRRILKWHLDPRAAADPTAAPPAGSVLRGERGWWYLAWSWDDRVLLVAGEAGRETPTLWCEQDCADDGRPHGDFGERAFVVVGTGDPPPQGWEHVGSAICGSHVWHVFAQDVPSRAWRAAAEAVAELVSLERGVRG